MNKAEIPGGNVMDIRNSVLMSAVMLSISACGGGDGNNGTFNPGVPGTRPLAAGTYKLVFTAVSTARLDAPISGIEVTVKLPAGLSVATTTGRSDQIADASVICGRVLQETALAFGNYSVSTRTAYLSVATSQGAYRGGQFLNLLFTVASGTSVSPNDIYNLNSTFSHYNVVGLNTDTHNTVQLTGKVQTTLAVAAQ